MKIIIKILLFLLIPFFLLDLVYADGWHLSDYDLHMLEPNQKAVIAWDGKTETMILSSAVKSNDISNFAWVVPIQSYTKPEVSAANISIFEDLVKYFKKIDVNSKKTDIILSGEGVEVLESKEIDVYDVTIIKATNSKDLIDWLNKNGYKVPEDANPILDSYVAEGDYYFIANKVDLKNKFKSEISQIESIYAAKEVQYNEMCKDINVKLSQKGIKNKICQKEHKYYLSSEIFGVISDYINGKENPLNLPIIYSKDLGNGITLKERLGTVPFTASLYDKNPKIFYFQNFNKPKTVLTLYKNGKAIDALSYIPFNESNSGERFIDGWIIKNNLKENKNLDKQDIQLITDFIDNKSEKTISLEIREQTDKILASFADSLNRNLGTKIYDCNELNHNLYYYYDQWFYSQKLTEAEQIPLGVKINAVASDLWRDSDINQSSLSAIYSANNDLRQGLGTPLKFKFQPYKPYYPLEISSLNLGKSIIEVYVLSKNPVSDQNDILKVIESKKINSAIRKKLEKQIPVASSKHVTRLSYNGELKNLTGDAEFYGEGIMDPPAISDNGLNSGNKPNLSQRIKNWVSRLFG